MCSEYVGDEASLSVLVKNLNALQTIGGISQIPFKNRQRTRDNSIRQRG